MFAMLIFRLLDEFYAENHEKIISVLHREMLRYAAVRVLVYFNLLYLIPRFFDKQKYRKYFLILIGALALISFILFEVYWHFEYMVPWRHRMGGKFPLFMFVIFPNTMILVLTTLFHFLRDWIRLKDVEIQLKQAEKDKLEAELKALKAQINPHFLFNSLNNIYSLSLDQSEKSPELLLKLSGLMRYILYDCNDDSVALAKEIEFIQNYIDLERIRFDNTLKIDMNISGDIEGKGIAPMLLMPFIENSFKHGASKNIGKMYIRINLEVVDDVLNFEISNNIPENKSRNPINPEVGGIGLSNVKKRLELGYEPKDYNLSIFEKDKMFNVILKLKVK